MSPIKIGFLASQRGSNMQAIIEACKQGLVNAEPAVVISNNRDAGALQRAAAEGIAGYHLSVKTEGSEDNLDQAICATLEKHEVELVVLAGYMRKIGETVLKRFRNRIVNIHPALLPKHGGQGMYGMRVHEAVIASGDKETGVTVHLVNEEYDRGKILAQVKVPVLEGESAESLASRVLEAEHRLYVQVIKDICESGLQSIH